MHADYFKIFELVKDGNLELITELLESYKLRNVKFNICHKDADNRNLLHWACYVAQEHILNWLLKNYHFRLDDVDSQGYTALELAILNNQKNYDSQVSMAQRLINAGAQVKRGANHQQNPLHWAFYYCNLRLIQLLLEENYQLFFDSDEKGLYPIDFMFIHPKPIKPCDSARLIFHTILNPFIRKLDQYHPGSCNFSKQSFNSNSRGSTRYPNDTKPENEPPIAYQTNLYTRRVRKNFRSITQANPQSVDYYNETDMPRFKIVQDDDEPEAEDVRYIDGAGVKYIKKPNLTPIHRGAILTTCRFKIITDQKIYQKKQCLQFLLRLLYWSAHFNSIRFVEYFMKRRCSPFAVSFQGYSPFHRAAQSGSLDVVSMILSSNYYLTTEDDDGKQPKSFERCKLLDKRKVIDMLSLHHPSTALHLAIEQEHYECAKFLVETGASPYIVNYRNMQPFKLTSNNQILQLYNDLIYKNRKENLYERGFLYVLQTKGRKKIEDDIVMIQLLNIKERFQAQNMPFEFIVMYGHTLETVKNYELGQSNVPKNFYYVIKFTHDTLYWLADKYGFYLYNLKNKLSQQFHYGLQKQFEFPKDLDIQQMILITLNEEFDVDKFILEGLLIQHFPIQDYNKYDMMVKFWKEELHYCIIDTMSFKTEQRALRPLHSMSQYYGPVIGWYFAFLVQLVAWLILPSIFGLAIAFYCAATLQLNSLLFPFFGLVMVFWATFFMESWKRRESELSFAWDMHLFKKREQTRVMYQGQWCINNISSKTEQFDKFTTFQRRLIMDSPVIFLGVGTVVAIFIVLRYLENLYDAQNNVTVKIFFGMVSGIIMNILSDIYKIVVNKVVLWENHKLDSEFQFSYIMKLFIFEFINSYIMLIYQALFEANPNQLAISVCSITITRGIIQNLKSNLIPYVIHKLKMNEKKINFKKIHEFFMQIVEGDVRIDSRPEMSPEYHDPPLLSQVLSAAPAPEHFSQNRLSISRKTSDYASPVRKQSYVADLIQLSNQSHLLEPLLVADQLELLEQLQLRDYMQDQKHLIDEYTDLAIQFGYITMFATSFPPAPIVFILNCYLNLRFSLHNYTNVMKREQAQPSESLGIWLNIFNIMSYSATLMNCLIIGLTYGDQLQELFGQGSKLRTVSVLLGIEHLVLLVKYLIAEIIDDVPGWVRRELKRCQIAEKNLKEKKTTNIKLV